MFSSAVTKALILAVKMESAPNLTKRQLEVLSLAANGLTNRQIALAIGITPTTVRMHFWEARSRLGADNRTEAVALAIRQGLLEESL